MKPNICNKVCNQEIRCRLYQCIHRADHLTCNLHVCRQGHPYGTRNLQALRSIVPRMSNLVSLVPFDFTPGPPSASAIGPPARLPLSARQRQASASRVLGLLGHTALIRSRGLIGYALPPRLHRVRRKSVATRWQFGPGRSSSCG